MTKSILFLVILLITQSIYGLSYMNLYIKETQSLFEQKSNKIRLSGDFPTTGTRSVVEPIVLIQYSTYIETIFYNNLGTIVIEIRDKENNSIVFQDSINTNIQKQYQILISNYGKGCFYIEFRNSQGQYMRGNFIIE